MWKSLEQKQAANKTPSKRCVSPCKIFHTWCKNEGKCREKGKDCTWYCECPSNCEGFFCEKKVDKDNIIDAGQIVEVKDTYEKEKKKPVSAFDKSKLAQALAGIFLKEKQTDEEKKTVLPDTIERVGDTIKPKVILNCPPGELNKKAPAANSSEQSTQPTITNVQNNYTNAITKSSMNISERTNGIITSTYPITDQTSTRSTEKPIVSSSYSETTTITTTTTAVHTNELDLNTNDNPTPTKQKNRVMETTTLASQKDSTSIIPVQSVNTTVSRISPGANMNLSEPEVKSTEKSTIPSDKISSSSSPLSTGGNVPSTILMSQTETKTSTQHQTVQSNVTSASPKLFSTTKSAITYPKIQSETNTLVTKPTVHIKQESTLKVPSKLSFIKQTTTSLPEQQYNKEPNTPVENSLYTQKTNIINVADKPNLLQLIEKAIEVESVSTTEQTRTESTTHHKSIVSTTVPTTISQNPGNSNFIGKTDQDQLSNSTTTAKPNDQNNIITNERENSIKSTNLMTIESSTLAKPSTSYLSTKEIYKSSHIYDQKTTAGSFITTIPSDKINLDIDGPNLKGNKASNTQDEITQPAKLTTPSVEHLNNDRTTESFSGASVTTGLETTSTTNTKSDAILTEIRKTTEFNKQSPDKISPSGSNNNNEINKKQISTESAAGKYKSTGDIISTSNINVSSQTNVPLLNMSQAITVSHDLPKTTKLEMSTVQTVMSNEITQQQRLSETSVENVKQSIASPPTTKQSVNAILLESKEGILTTSTTLPETNIEKYKLFKDTTTIDSPKTSAIKGISLTAKNKTLLNNSDQGIEDTNANEKLEISKSTQKEALSTSTPLSTETTTQLGNNEIATTTTAFNSKKFTASTMVHIFTEISTKPSVHTLQDITTRSIVNISDNSKRTLNQNVTNKTETPVTGTTASILIAENPRSSKSVSLKEQSVSTSIGTVTQTGATKPYLETIKTTTESVVYSADIGGSKLSFAKDILENKSDILNKSKVKSGLLNDKLSETVKDLLKMGLRDKGLPSDIDNIL
ncbi:mucin-22-like [Ruditapes philippinarum]|uniref:mucin-22-like n=1 Tax=Ruditapes philippinarum TaxID=129788 RepID=UPI00295B3BCC|nr:mucin-22-like [Ruditapes philippinarum]